jgi:hypothetical protein
MSLFRLLEQTQEVTRSQPRTVATFTMEWSDSPSMTRLAQPRRLRAAPGM